MEEAPLWQVEDLQLVALQSALAVVSVVTEVRVGLSRLVAEAWVAAGSSAEVAARAVGAGELQSLVVGVKDSIRLCSGSLHSVMRHASPFGKRLAVPSRERTVR